MTNTPDNPETGDKHPQGRPSGEPADPAGQHVEPGSAETAGQPTQPPAAASGVGTPYPTTWNTAQSFESRPGPTQPAPPTHPTQRFDAHSGQPTQPGQPASGQPTQPGQPASGQSGRPLPSRPVPSPDQPTSPITPQSAPVSGSGVPPAPYSGRPAPSGGSTWPSPAGPAQHSGGAATPPPAGGTPPPGAVFGAPLGAVPPPGGPGGPGQGEGPNGDQDANGQPKKRKFWVPVVSVAAVTALVVGVGTGLVFNALNDSNGTPTTISNLGQSGQNGDSNTAPVSGSTSQNPDWEAVDKAVASSVVSIQVELSNGEAEGSGLIIDTKGHIVTNNHVVSGAQDDQVQVTLNDGRIYSAKVVGTDTTTDLAVVQLQNGPSDLKPATLGDSSKVAVGESVMAVGNPLGLANTATTGIVSATNRPVSASGETSSTAVVTNAIQIDAAINPGNSGGPLFNAQGDVIGITSSIATLSSSIDSSSGSIGLGFAIPVNLVKNISGQLIDSGTAKHAYLGVGLNNGTATADGVTRQGALVTSVTSGSPADKAGIKKGDVIVAIDGNTVNGAESLTGYVREESAGQEVTLTVVRNGKAQDVNVTLAEKTETADSSSPDSGGSGSGPDGSGTNPFGGNGFGG